MKWIAAICALLGVVGLVLLACTPLPPPDPARSRRDCFVEWNPGCPRGAVDEHHDLLECRWPGEPPSDATIDLRPECKVASFEGGLMLWDGGLFGK